MWPFDTVLFLEGILPFVLIFVLVFAILQKTKVLGEGKNQIDALVSLIVGLILIGFPVPRNFILNILPWIAVGLVVILMFILLYGFIASDKKEGLIFGDNTKKAFLAIISIFVVAIVIYFSGFWDMLLNKNLNYNSWLPSILMLIVIGFAIAVAIGSGKKNDGK